MSRDRKAILELLTLLGVLTLGGHLLLPADPFFLSVHPHPFWAVLLLSALRYGNPVGLLAGLFCAALHIFALSLQGFVFAEAFHLGDLSLLAPFLYPAVGSLAGETIHKHQQRFAHLEQELDGVVKERNRLEGQCDSLEGSYRQLEARVAGEHETLLALHEGLRRFDSLQGRDIYHTHLRVLHDLLGIESVSLWIRRGNDPWSSFNPGEESRPLPRLAEISLREDRVVSASEFFIHEQVSPREGVLAGLLFSGGDTPCAVVVVEALAFRDYTRKTVETFTLLLTWTSLVLSRDTLAEEVRGQGVYDTDFGLINERFFATTLRKVSATIARTGEGSTLLLIRLNPCCPHPKQLRLRAFLATLLRILLRGNDTVAYLRTHDLFAAHLPLTTLEQAAIVQNKVQAAVDEYDIHPWGDHRPFQLCFGTVQLCFGTVQLKGVVNLEEVLREKILQMESGEPV